MLRKLLPDTLSRYIFLQTMQATLVITVILTFIIWLTQSLRLLDLIVNGGAPIGLFGYLLILAVPKFLEVVIPIAFAISLLFVMNKYSTDSELVVMRSLGLGFRAILKPLIVLSAFLAIFTFVLGGWVAPNANKEMDRLRDVIKSDYSDILLRDGVFNTLGDDLTVYIAEREGTQRLSGVMIHSTKEDGPPVTIWAERGELLTIKGQPHVVVYDGLRQQQNKTTGHIDTLDFKEYSINIAALESGEINAWVDEGERTLPDLISFVTDPDTNRRYIKPFVAEIHNRLTRPLLIFSFCLISFAMLFSGRFNRRGQNRKIAVSILALIVLQALYMSTVNWAASSSLGVISLYFISIAPAYLGWNLISRYDAERSADYGWRRKLERLIGVR